MTKASRISRLEFMLPPLSEFGAQGDDEEEARERDATTSR